MPEPHDTATTSRLDAALAARGLVKSRTAAVALILASRVTVNGVTATKPSTPVRDDTVLAVDPEDDWVSRAAHKLLAALDVFGVDPTGRVAMDVGASTGGFTQVLLARGAERVIALDVGHGQLDPRIAIDARVVSVEGTNARSLTADQVAAMDPEAARIDLVVGDLSFISLRIVLPALVDAVGARDLVLLVKPQFEVGRTGVREGIVHDPGLREDSVMNVLWAAWDLGLGTSGVAPSPIVGTHGNREYLVHLEPLDHTSADHTSADHARADHASADRTRADHADGVIADGGASADDAAGEHPGAVDGRPGPNPTEWIDLVRTTIAEGS